MDIKDIVNRDIVNLTNCEQEPIHIPGSIQPHGFLLGLKGDELAIDFCSGNISGFTGLIHTEVLGRTFNDVFGSGAVLQFNDYVKQGLMLSSTLLQLSLAGSDYLCTLHKSSDIYVLEAEPVNTDALQASAVYNQTSQFLNYMHDTHTLKELCELVAKGTREITGYDRVMIYRFDNDYNGEVFAEAKRDDLEPFLGLHYPHTDIPRQARELYMRNLLRIIVDINYTPVPVYTIDDAPSKNLDMSMSILRSTSPIHVQYLHNIGVGASLTISLIHQKKLWGLIACHHYSGSKNLTPAVRLSAQLQGHFITSQIALRQSNEEYEISRKTAIALEKVNTLTLNQPEDFNALVQQPEMLQVCNAAGVSVIFNGAVYKHGLTPTNEEILLLGNWLPVRGTSFYTDKLIDLLPDQTLLCTTTSGVIYHSLSNDNCIIWYRPETQTEVNWAGDPNKAIIKDEKGLSPRNSFALWKEVVNCRSKPWLEPELETASAYAHSLQRQINLLLITQEEEKYRKLSELLKETNSELENINWISTHDLQEPLRKIQLISSRILTKEQHIPETVQDSIKRMNASAQRMQTLLVDILKYTRLKHTEDSFQEVDLNAMLDDVKHDLAEAISETFATITDEALPPVNGIPFLLKQLFSNLISNSIKYAAPDRSPAIVITSQQPVSYSPEDPGQYTVISVADNGMGFEQAYAESIFNIFTRLHAVSDFKGSGVGLALCKKIMQNHNGYITAASEPGTGTVMNIYFPLK
jgi:chemotaxis family two-component system sensor kinase Cph1